MKIILERALLLFALLFGQMIFAQSIHISGTVNDENHVPIPGVNITVVGTDNGTTTDFDGKYSLDADSNSILEFSSIGFRTERKEVNSSQEINITLYEDTQSLDEVVITALGISRDKKSLGYSAQAVEGAAVSDISSGSFVESLSGKVSGLNIRPNTNFGGSTDVVIRGRSSISGDNQALFIVDGIPFSNNNVNRAEQLDGHGGSYDYGSPIDDIDPNSIKSMNFLKGAAAAALYGSRAANGVVLIETKDGSESKGMGITINSKFETGSMDMKTFPDYQRLYGTGSNIDDFSHFDVFGDGEVLIPSLATTWSNGPAFDPSIEVYGPLSWIPESPFYKEKTPWLPPKHGPKEIFKTPINLINSISIGQGGENSNYRLGYTNSDLHGILPNQRIVTNSISFNGSFKPFERLRVTGRANYVVKRGQHRNETGYSAENPMKDFRQFLNLGLDYKKLKRFYRETGLNYTGASDPSDPFNPSNSDNIYWALDHNFETDIRERFFGNVQLDYEVNDWFDIVGRISTDTYHTKIEERRANGSVTEVFGTERETVDSGYYIQRIHNAETNYDLLFNFRPNLNSDVGFNGLIGGNIRRNKLDLLGVSTGGGLVVPELYSLQNSLNALSHPNQSYDRIGVNGIFGSASFDYKELIFLDGTLRRDEFSGLPVHHKVVYYPSVSSSFLFGELFSSKFFTFGKLRLNYAEVGNGAPFDLLTNHFVVNPDIGNSSSLVRGNPDLKPERTSSIEVGLELGFWHNRLSLDFAFYDSETKDQILNLPVSNATGFNAFSINAGRVRNRGVEVSLNATPVKTDDWRWDLNANFSKNKNKVMELPDGVSSIVLGNYQAGVTLQARKGQPIGTIHGTDFKRNENGERLVDKNGRWIYTSASAKLGDMNPKWTLGISNTVSWKNLSLDFLIDIKHGGQAFVLDQYYGEGTGIYKTSTFINDLGNPVRNHIEDGGGFIRDGVFEDGTPNDVRVEGTQGQWGYQGNPNGAYVYSTGFIKLRELNLRYKLPHDLFQHTFIYDMKFGFGVKNLWTIRKHTPNIDPESGISSGTLGGFVAAAMPVYRMYAFNLEINL